MMDRIKVMNSTNPSYARLQALLLKDFVKRMCLIFLKDTNNMIGSKLVRSSLTQFFKIVILSMY